MYNTVEYSYETEKHHLTDDDALEAYKKAKRLKPNAIVVLDDLGCGHWDVDIYESPEQKETLFRKRLNKILNQWRSKATTLK